MLINIESGDAKSPRKVRVEPDDGDPVEFTAENLKDAHKQLAAGRKDGWDSLRPAKAVEPPDPAKAPVKAPEPAKKGK